MWIRISIGVLEDRYGADKAFPVTVALHGAYEEARKMEAAEQGSRKVEDLVA